uniref:Secreted protein n=1 Tax=Lactuca sativa TaxID=4236 RepID=A0A9R1WPN6_LACSA|nr:hypothetical protein LSAT_V11C100000530 [Lactuca sativa]
MHPRLFFLSAFSFYLLSTCSYITRAQKSSIATTGVNLTFIQKHIETSCQLFQNMYSCNILLEYFTICQCNILLEYFTVNHKSITWFELSSIPYVE